MTFTANQIKDSFLNPANLANINDPMQLAAVVTMQYGAALEETLRVQATKATQTTTKLSSASDALGDINNAAARLQDNSNDSATTYVGQQYYGSDGSDGQAAAQAEYQKLVDAKVDEGTINPPNKVTDPNGVTCYQITMTKVNISAAGKNIQIQLDSLSSTSSNDQLGLSNTTGKYNTAIDQITSYIKSKTDMASSVLRNLLMT